MRSVAGGVASPGEGVGAAAAAESPDGIPVSTGGGESGAAFATFGASPPSAILSGARRSRPERPAISPKKKARPIASSRPAKSPTAWRAVSEIW